MIMIRLIIMRRNRAVLEITEEQRSDPRHKGSQPRVATAAVQAKIARRTQQKPAWVGWQRLCGWGAYVIVRTIGILGMEKEIDLIPGGVVVRQDPAGRYCARSLHIRSRSASSWAWTVEATDMRHAPIATPRFDEGVKRPV